MEIHTLSNTQTEGTLSPSDNGSNTQNRNPRMTHVTLALKLSGGFGLPTFGQKPQSHSLSYAMAGKNQRKHFNVDNGNPKTDWASKGGMLRAVYIPVVTPNRWQRLAATNRVTEQLSKLTVESFFMSCSISWMASLIDNHYLLNLIVLVINWQHVNSKRYH